MQKRLNVVLAFPFVLAACGGGESTPAAISPVAETPVLSSSQNPVPTPSPISTPAPSANPGTGEESNTGQAVNVMACTTDGGISVRESKKNLLGTFGIRGNALIDFSMGIEETVGGNKHAITIMAGALPTVPGKYTFPAVALPSYRITGESFDKAYTGMGYVLFYEGDPKISSPLTWEINVQRAERLPAPASPAGAVRVHLVGDFNFNAVYAPPHSEACTNDYMARMSYPMFNAAICGAEKVKVACTFDVTEDIPPYPM